MIKSLILFIERFVAIPDLGLRLWVAWVFYKSGLTKVTLMGSDGMEQYFPTIPPQITSTTIMLFQHEYKVPFIPYEFAAWSGTYVELIFPVLLALGLAGRWAAGVLFVFNIIAVVSYSSLNAIGIAQHQLWGLILLYLFFRGPGKLSFDHFIRWRHMPENIPNP